MGANASVFECMVGRIGRVLRARIDGISLAIVGQYMCTVF